jgi:hypothetical protein
LDSYGWFTEGFDALDLKQAAALLDDLHHKALVDREAPGMKDQLLMASVGC